MWRHTRTPNRANPWEGDGWQATDEEARPKDQSPSRKQWYVQASRTGSTQVPLRHHTEPVEGWEEPRNNSPEAVASQGWARAPHPHPSTRMTTSSSQRRYGATARVHRAQGTQNRSFRDREPAPPWPRHPEPEGDWDRRSLLHATTCGNMNCSHRWRCAAQADQEHLTARTGYKSIPLRLYRVGRADTVKPANRGAREGPEHIITKPVTKAKDNPPPLPEGEPLKT